MTVATAMMTATTAMPIHWLSMSVAAPASAPVRIRATASTRLTHRVLSPPASRESEARPTIVEVTTTVVTSAIFILLAAAAWAPMSAESAEVKIVPARPTSGFGISPTYRDSPAQPTATLAKISVVRRCQVSPMLPRIRPDSAAPTMKRPRAGAGPVPGEDLVEAEVADGVDHAGREGQQQQHGQVESTCHGSLSHGGKARRCRARDRHARAQRGAQSRRRRNFLYTKL